jgi:hypothetical protein
MTGSEYKIIYFQKAGHCHIHSRCVEKRDVKLTGKRKYAMSSDVVP